MQLFSIFSVFLILFLKDIHTHESKECLVHRMHQFCEVALRNSNLITASPDETATFNSVTPNFISDQERVNTFGRDCDSDVDFLTKCLEVLKDDQQRVDFVSRLTENDLNASILRVVAENFVKESIDNEKSLSLLLLNHRLLLSAPPTYLFNLSTIQKINVLFPVALAMNNSEFCEQQPKLTKRTWAKLLYESNNVIPNLLPALDNFGCILEEASLEELKNYLKQNGNKLPHLEKIKWSTVQVRKIIEVQKNTTNIDEFAVCFLPRLLPEHIQFLMNKTQLKLPDCIQTLNGMSLPTAVQLFEFFKMMRTENSNFTSLLTKTDPELIGKLLRSQSSSALSTLFKEKIPMNKIAHFDSAEYSLLQARSILGENGIREYLYTNDLLQLRGLIAAIPASLIINFNKGAESETYVNHILQYSPRGNRMRAMAILQRHKTLQYTNCLKIAIDNVNNEVVSLISPLEISSTAAEILEFFQEKIKENATFEERIANLPSYVLKELWPRQSKNITYENVLDNSDPLYLAILGLDCEIIKKIPTTDFLSVFNLYNKHRKLFKKQFPKDMQKCAQMAFLSHLRAKSLALNKKVDNELMRYLDLDDIRSIGGYVLATLPVDIILTSKFCDDIIEEIGHLSLSELMLAVPKQHLTSLISKYLKKEIGENMVEVMHLVRLGNLIHFFDEFYLAKVRPSALKFILEANVIDTRLCASVKMRNAWGKLLDASFGPLEKWEEDDVLNVGDMLIVFASSLSNLRHSVSLNTADLVKSSYNDDIEWVPRRSSFYKACSLILSDENEILSYTTAIKELVMFYASSIESLLDTIVQGSGNQNENLWKHLNKGFISQNEETSESGETLSDTYSSDSNQQAERNIDLHNSARQAEITDESADAYAQSVIFKEKIETTTTVLRNIFENGEKFVTTSPSTPDSGSNNVEEHNTDISSTRNISDISSGELLTDNIMTFETNAFTDQMRFPTSTILDSAEDLNAATNITAIELTTPITTAFLLENDKQTENSATFPEHVTSHLTTEISPRSGSPVVTPLSSFATESESTLGSSNINVTPSEFDIIGGGIEYKFLNESTNSTVTITSSLENTNITTVGIEYGINTPTTSESSLSASRYSVTSSYVVRENTTSSVSSVGVDSKLPDVGTEIETQSTHIYDRSIEMENHTESNGELNLTRATQSSNITTEELHKILQIVLAAPNLNTRRKRQTDAKSNRISCKTLKVLGSASVFVIPSANITVKETVDCVELLGRMDLDDKIKKDIWLNLNDSAFGDANLKFVAGKILSILSEHDYEQFKFNITSDWALELISAISENIPISSLNDENLANLAYKIIHSNAYKNDPTEFPAVFIVALGKMICSLESSTLDKLLKANNKAFSDIWTVFHALDNCPMNCLRRIARVAVEKLKEPALWTPAHFTMLGPVAAAVPGILNYTSYLHKSAIECLASESFSSDLLHEEFIEKIPFTSTLLLLEKQRNDTTSQVLNSTVILMKREWFKTEEKVESSTSKGDFLQSNLFLFTIFCSAVISKALKCF